MIKFDKIDNNKDIAMWIVSYKKLQNKGWQAMLFKDEDEGGVMARHSCRFTLVLAKKKNENGQYNSSFSINSRSRQ